MQTMRVAVVGSGYVGTVTATCLALLGHQVVGLDADAIRTQQLAAGQLPFYEPGLPDLLRQVLATGRLSFASDPETAISSAELIFLCVGTPTGPAGLPDLSQVESAVAAVAPQLQEGATVVNKSTVPVGSGNWVRTLLEEALPHEGAPEFFVVSNPEFLREGSAVEDFLHPDRLVLGGEDGSVERVCDLYSPLLKQSFEGGRPETMPSLFVTDLASAEMIKYAANAFLATKVSFANEIASVCELVGADARQVLPAIGADCRIGPSFLHPGIGWGGSCFGKDVAALMATGLDYGYTSPVLRGTVEVNNGQRVWVIRKLQQHLKVLKGRRVALLGLAFKPGTDDLRDAPALEIARRLLAAGAVVAACDPVVKQLPEDLQAVQLHSDPYDAARRADALVLCTEWPELTTLQAARLAQVMRGDVVIDGRNCFDESAFRRAGLRIVGVGW
jgi:UDPglucose 6-dehydrogenase